MWRIVVGVCWMAGALTRRVDAFGGHMRGSQSGTMKNNNQNAIPAQQQQQQHERMNSNSSSSSTRKDFMNHVAFVASFAATFGHPATARATSPESSSLSIADAIQTMDFSLPSSYGDISNAKASGQSLTNEYVAPAAPAVKKERKSKEKNTDSSNPLGAVLPSLNKKSAAASNNKATRQAAATEKPPREKKEKAPEYEIVDFGLPSYDSGTASKQKSVFSL